MSNYTYQPFGATTVGGSANANSYEFTGRENDGNGLYFYRRRYLSPTFQNFIAQDPIGFAGGDANFYAYVKNNSPNLADPFGTCPQCAPSGGALSPADYQEFGNDSSWPASAIEALEFHRGGSMDAQASGASAEYGNYVFGVYMAASGYPLNFTLSAGNAYTSEFSHYPPRNADGPQLPRYASVKRSEHNQGI